jgi:hypothetical protein
MTPKTPRRTSGAAAPAPPLVLPSEPVAPRAGQKGTPPPEMPLEARSGGGPDVPGAAQPLPGEGRNGSTRPPGASQEALSGAEARKAIAAAQAALSKAKRNRRARPWAGRDPYRNAVPGVRKMPGQPP